MIKIKLLKKTIVVSFFCVFCFVFVACSSSVKTYDEDTYPYSDYMYDTVYGMKNYNYYTYDDLSAKSLSSDTLTNVTSSSTDTFSNGDMGYMSLTFSYKENVEVYSITFTVTAFETIYFNLRMVGYSNCGEDSSGDTTYSYSGEEYDNEVTLLEGESQSFTLYYETDETYTNWNRTSCSRISWEGLDAIYRRIGIGLNLYQDANFNQVTTTDYTEEKPFALSNFSFEFSE